MLSAMKIAEIGGVLGWGVGGIMLTHDHRGLERLDISETGDPLPRRRQLKDFRSAGRFCFS